VLYTIILSIAIGLVIGMLSGALGIGGGTVMVPVFKLVYGMPAVMCTATSLFTIIPTSITGAITHTKNKTCILAIGIAAGIGGAITSPIGVALANVAPEWTVMVFAAVVILYSCFTMFQKALKAPKKHQPSSTLNQAKIESSQSGKPAAPSPATYGKVSIRQAAIAVCIGLIAGLASGFVGVGGGFIMVPMMMQLLKTPMKLTSGTSLIAVMILAIPGTITQALYGNINWVAGICVAIGSIPGAIIGANAVKFLPERILRFIFSGFLLFAAIMLILEQVGII
jgi:hypothetical protein